ncbi:MAG: acetylxylan esterase [bacterium]
MFHKTHLTNLKRIIHSAIFAGLLSVCGNTQTPDDPGDYPEPAVKYLQNIFSKDQYKYSFRTDYPGGFETWQQETRPVLRRLIGLQKISAQVGNHQPTVELNEMEDLGEYTRQRGSIETEPDVQIPFWILKPKSAKPCPIAILPHGHDTRGYDTHAGVYHDEAHRERTLEGDRDVAVQAVKHGFVAIAPATRGLADGGLPDIRERHEDRGCRAQLIHCLLAGRTAIGERVWDMERLIDWAVTLPEVNPKNILMMGNSGGGVLTLYAAACDERIKIAVPSCSFTTFTSPNGYIYHCDCNLVPGILELGDMYDVAGLIAPRYLLAVNGRKDSLHSAADIERSAAGAKAIYTAAGCPERFEHRWGEEGHRFYKDLTWPFIHEAITSLSRSDALESPLPQDKTARLVADPVESIRAVLPKGWIILRVHKETCPWFLQAGKGTAVHLAREGKEYVKMDLDVAVFIMPADYGGRIDTDAAPFQFPSPRLAAHISDAKIYIWGGGPPIWPTMTEDILGALIVKE